MDCNEIKNLLYEELTGINPDKEISTIIEAHLQECRGCREEKQVMIRTIKALDAIKPPELSAGFQSMVLQKAQAFPLPTKRFSQRIKEWFQVPYLKYSMEGLAATAVIVIALAVYKGINPTRPSKMEMIPRNFQIEISGTTTTQPIIIPTNDLGKTLSDLKGLIIKYNGQLLQANKMDQMVQVTFKMKKENDAAFLSELKKSFQTEIKSEEFRDENGNVVILLRTKTKDR